MIACISQGIMVAADRWREPLYKLLTSKVFAWFHTPKIMKKRLVFDRVGLLKNIEMWPFVRHGVLNETHKKWKINIAVIAYLSMARRTFDLRFMTNHMLFTCLSFITSRVLTRLEVTISTAWVTRASTLVTTAMLVTTFNARTAAAMSLKYRNIYSRTHSIAMSRTNVEISDVIIFFFG